MQRMAKWEEMGRRREEKRRDAKRREEKRREVVVALTEMLIDALDTMRNEPPLSPMINYKPTHAREDINTCIHVNKLVHHLNGMFGHLNRSLTFISFS